ncbi:MAG: sirohydrochlorin chelatase [Thermosynechococcaceae cyanobacterium]
MQHHSTAYFLVAHGSRDVRSQQSFQQLTDLFRQGLAPSGVSPHQIHGGTLEFGLPLAQQLQQVGGALNAASAEVKIVPLFLLSGTHLRSDIPEAITVAQQQSPHIKFTLTPHLGSHSGVLALLRDRITSDYPWILLAHGSRYPGGNAIAEEISAALGTQAAYWSVAPKLEESLAALVDQGHRTVGVLPYFLFSGRITDAILQQIYQLRCRFDNLDLKLAAPLNPSPALAQLLIDLI